MSLPPTQGSKKSILIVRLGKVGDVVVSSPIASAIKQKRPDWHITWLTESQFTCLLEGNPDVDEVISWDNTYWKNTLAQRNYLSAFRYLKSIKSLLHARRYEIAIDLQGQLKSGVITWLSGAKHRIGLGSSEGSSWLMTKTISRELGDQSQIGSEYRYLVSQLGYNDTPWQMCAPTEPLTVDSETGRLLNTDNNYLVICPFSSKIQHQWPESYWTQLCLRIRGRYHLKAVILGSEDNFEAAQSIARNCGGVNLAGKTSTLESTEIIKKANIVIGIDTCHTHIAHAFKTPAIALFGASSPYNYTGSESSKVLYLDRYCSPCHNNPICKGKYECMTEISPDTVLSETKALLKTNNAIQL